MNCEKCGSPIAVDVRFCPQCGAPQAAPLTIIAAPPAVAAPQPHQTLVVVQQPRHTPPVPGPERCLWEGQASVFLLLIGLIWSGIWLVAWLWALLSADEILRWAIGLHREVAKLLGQVHAEPKHVAWAAGVMMIFPAWGILRRMLEWLNTHYTFTTQRIQIQQGILSRRVRQMELFRLKDISYHQTFWGMFFGYATISLASGDRFASSAILPGIPNARDIVEQIRRAAQISRAESGYVQIQE